MLRFTLASFALAGLGGLLASGPATEQPDAQAVHSAVARSLPALRAQGDAWIEEHGCVSCHHVPFLIWTHNEARDRGLEIDVTALEDWTEWALEKTDRYDNKNVDGMHQLILGRAGAAADRMVSVGERLLSHQQEDGSWHAAGQLPGQRRPEAETHRATTIWSLLALGSLDYSTDSVVTAWVELRDWLNTDGEDESQELVNLRMLAQNELDNLGGSERWQLEVLERQNPDGGWGWLRDEPSDALATGQTLYALARVGVGSEHPAVRKAQRFLIDTQREDGTWGVTTTLNHPSNPAISSYWGTGWAAIGLLGSSQPAVDATTPASPSRDRIPEQPASGTLDSGLKESVEVGYVALDARALDSSGRPIVDLAAGDFRVRVDGLEVDLTSAEWIAAAIPPIDEAQAAGVPGLDLSGWPRGRLIVLFFQRDLIPSRMAGLMRVRSHVAEFVANLPAEDLVATVVHDTRLWLHTDFTADRELLAEVLDGSIIEHRQPAPIEPNDGPSLLVGFDFDAAERASSAEAALLVVARALEQVPGSKAIVFVGWGLGRYDADPVTASRSLRTLLDARAALFALDVTDADYHTLEGPLFEVAMETGGLYLKTDVLSEVAMRRMAGAIEGHYELSFPKPDLPSGRHRLTIDLREVRGTVYHRDFYED